MSLIIAFLAGVAFMWLVARIANARMNAKKISTIPEGQVQGLGGCYWHCVTNGFPWVGSTCTYICPGGGGGGTVQ